MMILMPRAVFGRAFARQSNQPIIRNYPQADNQTFRVTRGIQAGTARVSLGGQMATKPIFTPLPDYWRVATCEEADCRNYHNGWVIRLDLSPGGDPEDLHLNQARSRWLHHECTKAFTVTWDGSTEVFRFEAGQRCFTEHRLPVDREPILLHITGPGRVVRQELNQWTDNYNETAYLLNRRRAVG